MEVKVNLQIFPFESFTDKVQLSIGSGEFGKVYVAKHRSLGLVTLKVVSHDLQNDRDKLKHEAEDLFKLASDYVVMLVGVVLEPRNVGLVMEYMAFGSIEKCMQFLPKEYFGWPLRVRIVYETAKGIQFLHDRKIIHQGIKPSNVMLNEHMHVKLSECGLRHIPIMETWTRCAATYHATVARSEIQQTSVAHIPPELINDINLLPTESTDIYAYGIFLWSIITKEKPYNNLSNEEILDLVGDKNERPDIINIETDEYRPKILQNLMSKCWDKNFENRPNINAVIADLHVDYMELKDRANNLAFACSKLIHEYNVKNNIPTEPAPSYPESGCPLNVKNDSDVVERVTEGNRQVVHPSGEHSVERSTTNTVQEHSKEIYENPETSPLKAQPIYDNSVRYRPTQLVQRNDSEMAASSSSSYPSEFFSLRLHSPNSSSITDTDLSDSILMRGDELRNVSQQEVPAIPAENCTHYIKSAHLYQVATHMGKRWRRFGEIILGYSEGELDNFEFGQTELKEIVYKMLVNWTDRCGGKHTVTVARLVAELKKGGLVDVARRINT